MINFTVGPVQSNKIVRDIASEQIPYFRTEEFSNLMKENENLIKKFSYASDDSKVVFLTGSGTAAMEASVINSMTFNDKALVVNGGSFGKRYTEILKTYGFSYDEIKLEYGHSLKKGDLDKYDGSEYSVFIVNLLETSTGVLYDIDLISEYCRKNNILLIVDAISSFLADNINMKKNNIDILITGSQKVLACDPGISILVLSKRSIEIIENNNFQCYYLNLKKALKYMENGQTPFTPAVGILRQINARLKEIDKNGGTQSEIAKIKSNAIYFRDKIKKFNFEIASESLSNATTALHPKNNNAYEIFLELKNKYGILVAPNIGELKDKIFRVGHIGNLNKKDINKLIRAFRKLNKKGLL